VLLDKGFRLKKPMLHYKGKPLFESSNNLRDYFLVLFVFGVVYVFTCAPGVLWQDSGLFQYRIWNNDIVGRLGLALSHPLYHMIGIMVRHIPLGDFAYRVNLISAFFAAVSAANMFLLVRLWLNRTFPAVVATVSFGLAWTIWQHGCIAEVYSLYTAFFLAELIVLLQYCKTGRVGYLCWLALLNGLALANHMWAVIPLACYLVYVVVLLVKKQVSWRWVVLMAVLWLAGASPYLYLIVNDFVQGGDFRASLLSAAFGNNWQSGVTNVGITWKIVVENILFLGLNYPTPNALLFFVGAYALYKTTPSRAFGHIFVAVSILFFVFAFRYTVPDRYAFFIPFYCLSSAFIGVGVHVVMSKKKNMVLAGAIMLCTLLPIPVYAIVPTVAKKLNVNIGLKRSIPFRDEYTYFLQPWQNGNYGPMRFSERVFSVAQKNAVIYADSTPVYTLWYRQEIEGERKDIEIVSSHVFTENSPLTEDRIEQTLAERPVYVLSNVKGYCPGFLLRDYDFKKVGCIWRVVGRKKEVPTENSLKNRKGL